MFAKLLSQYHQWLTTYSALNEATKQKYFRQIECFIAYLNSFQCYYFNDISPERLHAFLHVHGEHIYSEAWVRVRVASLQLFFRWAYEKQLCSQQPILRYKRAKITHKPLEAEKEQNTAYEMVFLSVAEQRRLLKHIKPNDKTDFLSVRNAAIITLLLASGLFAEELIAFRVENLQLKKGRVVTHFSPLRARESTLDQTIDRTIYRLWLNIRQQIVIQQKIPWLFFTHRFEPLSKRVLYKIVSEGLNSAGIFKKRAGPEVLRQTAILNRLRAGIPIETIGEEMGIKTLAQLTQYRQYL